METSERIEYLKERLAMYKRAYEFMLETVGNYRQTNYGGQIGGLCMYVGVGDTGELCNVNLNEYPEIYKYKPKKTYNKSFWYCRISETGIAKRKEILEKVIEDITAELKSLDCNFLD